MPKFDAILQHERRLRAFTGLDAATFTDFLPHFASVMEEYLRQRVSPPCIPLQVQIQ